MEDEVAEEAERVRARKEGGDAWNQNEQKHFVRTYSLDGAGEGEDIREGFDPAKVKAKTPHRRQRGLLPAMMKTRARVRVEMEVVVVEEEEEEEEEGDMAILLIKRMFWGSPRQ